MHSLVLTLSCIDLSINLSTNSVYKRGHSYFFVLGSQIHILLKQTIIKIFNINHKTCFIVFLDTWHSFMSLSLYMYALS